MISKGKRDWLVLKYRPDGPFTDRKGRLCLKHEGNVYRNLVPVSCSPVHNLRCDQPMEFELNVSDFKDLNIQHGAKGATNV